MTEQAQETGTEVTETPAEAKLDFAGLGLGENVLKAISDAGYTTPTPIQAQAIPHVLAGKDVMGIAQTGTGKTAGFTLPMIDRLGQGRAKARMPRSLILCPTRELAAQVAENFETYGKYHKLSMALLIGGVAFAEQERKIDRGVDVLIATPGRLLDHVERGKLVLLGVQILVVDEADRMLDMGFIPDVERICALVPPRGRQMLFFSATMAPEIARLTKRFLNNPERVEVARQSTTAENVEQGLAKCAPRAKRATLRKLIDREEIKNAIIFCNRKRDVTELFNSLSRHGYSVGALHGDIPQNLRTQTLDDFRTNKLTLLVASDVAARGLDIPAVSHVFNFDVPFNAEDYVHRIGRTGRAGRSGKAYTLVSRSDEKYLSAIEGLIKKPIPVLDGFDDQPTPEQAQDEQPRKSAAEKAEKPKQAEKAEKPKKAEKADKPEKAEKADKPEKAERPAEKGKKKGRRKNDDPALVATGPDKPVVGLGDHVPAFLLRPAKTSSSRKSSTAAD